MSEVMIGKLPMGQIPPLYSRPLVMTDDFTKYNTSSIISYYKERKNVYAAYLVNCIKTFTTTWYNVLQKVYHNEAFGGHDF